MNKIKKIVIIGGESTGKSTLSKALAEHYKTQWVPEFAREYLEKLNRTYNQNDLTIIAKGQLKLEDEKAKHANQFLFCDTDLNVIKVWSEFKYNSCENKILNFIATRKYDAYILTSPDFPWQDDPLREHPNEKDRKNLFIQYKEILISLNLPFCIVKGNELERFKNACNFISLL